MDFRSSVVISSELLYLKALCYVYCLRAYGMEQFPCKKMMNLEFESFKVYWMSPVQVISILMNLITAFVDFLLVLKPRLRSILYS